MKIFEAVNASKQINGFMVLKEISISISQGERIAITGKNGSGKSSLLKLVGGIYEETAGQIQRSKIEIGYVPEHFPEQIRFNLKDYLLLTGKMSGKSVEGLSKRIKHFAELFAVVDYLHTPLKVCSKGTKQKAGIIQALLKEPDLLLLDEPLTGLDDKAQIELLNQLNSLQKDMTIIFTAHNLLLVDRIADRVIIVEGGRIISDSTKNKNEKVRIIKATIPTREIISEISCIHHEFMSGNSVEITVSAAESDKVLMMLLERGGLVLELIEKR